MATNVNVDNQPLFDDLTELPLGEGPRVPAIPVASPEVRQLAIAIEKLKEIVELREGIRGSSVDMNVTWRDLFQQGIASIKIGNETYTSSASGASAFVGTANDLSTPPAPTNLTADGGMAVIILSWDDPNKAYGNHAYTEIWRSTEDNIGTAVMIGTSQSFMYNDSVGASAKNYYWIRFVSTSDVTGPYNAVDGVLGETSLDPAYVLSILSGQISESQLFQSLSDRIDLIDGAITLPNSVNSRLLSEANKRAALAAQLIGNYTGTDLNQLTAGLLYQESAIRNTADSNLAQQITLLAAGVSGGFDVFKTWYFDLTTSDWVAANNVTLTAANGWVNVDATGTNPSITLQSNLTTGVNGGQYSLVKIRVRRKSGTGWSGKVYYSTEGHGFSSSYYKAAANPNIAVGEDAIVEWDMHSLTAGGTDWKNSTITNFKIELGADATDDFEVDWIAVGRNAPGASVAAIAEEASARASGDASEATARSILSTKILGVGNPDDVTTLEDVTTGIIYEEKVARSDAVSGVASSVEALSASVATDISTLSSNIQQEATTRASDDAALATTIESVSAVANAKNKTFYQTSEPSAGESEAGDIWFDTDDDNKVYRYSGTAWEEAFDARIAANASAITDEATARADADSALATSIETLSATVDDNNTAVNAAIEDEATARADADTALATSIETLQATVTTNEETFSALVEQEAIARAEVDGSLGAQYTVKLDVANHIAGFGLAASNGSAAYEVDYTLVATAILSAYIGKTDATALLMKEEFNGRKLGDITNDGAITLVDALDVIKYSNGSSLASTSVAYIEGVLAPRLLANTTKYAALLKFNNAITSEFGVRADRFYIAPPANVSSTTPTTGLYVGYTWVNSSTTPPTVKYYNGTGWQTTPPSFPFVVQVSPTTIGGESVPAGVYIDTAYIKNGSISKAKIGDAVIDTAKIADAAITSAKIGDAQIQTAHIDDAQIGTAQIAEGSITEALIGDAEITNAKIKDGEIDNAKIAGAIKSSDYKAGSKGWQIDKDGAAEFNNATFRGSIDVKSASTGARMTMTNSAIKVYDTNGVLRVVLGDLS